MWGALGDSIGRKNVLMNAMVVNAVGEKFLISFIVSLLFDYRSRFDPRISTFEYSRNNYHPNSRKRSSRLQ